MKKILLVSVVVLLTAMVVQNSYISLIGYQNQGYAFLPMD